MRRTTAAIIVIATFILVSGIASIIFANTLVTTVEYPTSFEIRPYLGFNLNPDGIHLGAGPPGTILHRDLILKANATYKYQIKISKNFEEYLRADSYTGVLNAGETKTIRFYATIPEMPEGTYNGTVRTILVRRP
jgi:hypothetical protein